MSIPAPMLGSNPFFEAYFHSDFLGKMIFLGLFLLSVLSWVVIIHKTRVTRRVKALAEGFSKEFDKQQQHPLNVTYQHKQSKEFPHPFFQIYTVLRENTLAILNKNLAFVQQNPTKIPGGSSYLSPSDIELVECHLGTAVASQTKALEKNLYILSTTITLAPFLGLLGTVWGILTTFAELQSHTMGASNQVVLQGLSLALATTVLGLLDAIPAVIGYNYLKAAIKDFQTDMENFANRTLSSVELHYRKVDAL